MTRYCPPPLEHRQGYSCSSSSCWVLDALSASRLPHVSEGQRCKVSSCLRMWLNCLKNWHDELVSGPLKLETLMWTHSLSKPCLVTLSLTDYHLLWPWLVSLILQGLRTCPTDEYLPGLYHLALCFAGPQRMDFSVRTYWTLCESPCLMHFIFGVRKSDHTLSASVLCFLHYSGVAWRANFTMRN